jgi:hypothetical protein
MTKLFMVYLGGSAGNSNIEVHDVRFVTGDSIDATIPQLKQQWYGNQKNLHIDCYMEVNHIDGYQVDLTRASVDATQQGEKLYFVNLGGYAPSKFTELHEVGLFVANSAEEAKQKAKFQLLRNATTPHKDNLLDVDDCFVVDLFNDRLRIKLTPKDGGQEIKPDWFGYRVI